MVPYAPTQTLRALGAALLLALAGCGGGDGPSGGPSAEAPATPLTTLVAQKVSADLGQPDPAASFWSKVPAGSVQLIAQPMIAPRPESTTTETLTVQAAHDGQTIAFRLRWKDTEKSEAGRLGEYSDAVALQFPVKAVADTPVVMGAEGTPVHIFHWRAQYQRDVEQGKPEIAALYPNASIDMYAMEFHDAPSGSRDEREMFNPGVALGNPQSFHKSSVDEIIAEGFATSAVQAGHGSAGKGAWVDGQWTVVITRPLRIEGGSTLTPGTDSALTFAVWQGGLGEVGSRKCLYLQWVPLQVSP